MVGLGTLVLVVMLIYWGRPVLMPLAVAVLLTFLLNPVASALHRRGVPRAPAVLLVVILVTCFLGGVIFTLGQQLTGLAGELPLYKDNIRQKVAEFRMAGKETVVEKLQKTFREIIGEIKRDEQKAEETAAALAPPEEELESDEKPVSVVVEGDKSARKLVPSALGPLIELIATMGLVVVLVIFMLLRQQEIRNRLIRLVGHSRLSTTTKALDEAGERISRYLQMQTIINATYGLALGAGLFLIGLPYVILMGFLAFLMRFIPYVGPWLGAIIPIGVSLAIFDGWLYPFVVIALVLGLELLTNMIMEPLLYGQSAGVSEVALIVAIAFWTWVWGAVGLALATPLTVCLVVLCKYIPELEFVETLMGDEPVMDARSVYYQRLVAGDQDEAAEVVQEYLRGHGPEQLCDEVLVAALTFAKQDAERRKLTEADLGFILEATGEVIEHWVPQVYNGGPEAESEPERSRGGDKLVVLACPARDEADEVALTMLRRLLSADLCDLEVLPAGMLSSEVIACVAQKRPAVFCIGALPPDPLAPTKYLCKRLRDVWPDLKIVIGRWGLKTNVKETKEPLLEAGADFVATSLVEARSQIMQCAQITSQVESIIRRPAAHSVNL